MAFDSKHAFLQVKQLLINYSTRSTPEHVNDGMKNAGVNEYNLKLFPGFADIVYLEACGIWAPETVSREIKPNGKHLRHFISLSTLIQRKLFS